MLSPIIIEKETQIYDQGLGRILAQSQKTPVLQPGDHVYLMTGPRRMLLPSSFGAAMCGVFVIFSTGEGYAGFVRADDLGVMHLKLVA